MIMGDLNAKVGSTRADDHLREVVVNYGLGVRNEREVRDVYNFAQRTLLLY